MARERLGDRTQGCPGAPAPAADAARRQRQLKQWPGSSRRTSSGTRTTRGSSFAGSTGRCTLTGTRTAASSTAALYTLANGTNPEIMLFVEARADPKDASRTAWQFAVGRLAHAELHLVYDGKEVFDAPARTGLRLSAPDKPYWLGPIESSPTAKPDK